MLTPILFLLLLAAHAPATLGIFEQGSDVGDELLPGSARFDSSSGRYEVTGGGSNMWGAKDDFHFLWRKHSGDVRLSCAVQIVTSGDPHQKAGLMIRESLEADSPYVDVVLHADGLASLQYRETKGGETREIQAPLTSPSVLVLQRRGDRFTFWVGPTKEDLKESGSISLTLPRVGYVGLAVCAHDRTRHSTALFSDVAVD
jgi:TolB protein